ncbi:MAG: hypothetical protein RR201_02735 [Malacoplasma sp.]
MTNGFSKKINYKTPSIVIFSYSFFIIIVPYLIIWLLLGDVNLLKLDWIVPVGIKISETAINSKLILNYYIFLTLIAVFIFSIIIFILIKFVFKKASFDLIPFCIMFNAMGISTVLSGLIPFYEDTKTYIIISRFIIVIVATLLSFFIFTKLSTYLLFKYEDINRIAVDYKVDEVKLEQIKKEYNDIKTKQNKENNETFIEVIKED